MSWQHQHRPQPRERTFAELFPWRNILRALMLVLLILAIVSIKRSTGFWLARVTDLWGPPAPAGMSGASGKFGESSAPERRARLGPGLAPAPAHTPPATGTSTP